MMTTHDLRPTTSNRTRDWGKLTFEGYRTDGYDSPRIAAIPGGESVTTQNKRMAPTSQHPSESLAKKQIKWSAEENDLIVQLRGSGMKWEDISKRLPGRSAISCRLHYQNFLERRPEWDEDKKNKLARLYERFRKQMWEAVAQELQMPWRAVEAMHWELGNEGIAQRAGVAVFSTVNSSSASTQAAVPRNAYTTMTGAAPMSYTPAPHVLDTPEIYQPSHWSEAAQGGALPQQSYFYSYRAPTSTRQTSPRSAQSDHSFYVQPQQALPSTPGATIMLQDRPSSSSMAVGQGAATVLPPLPGLPRPSYPPPYELDRRLPSIAMFPDNVRHRDSDGGSTGSGADGGGF